MSKLPKEYKFLDLSDYGRPIARSIASSLKHTSFTPIHITIGFIIAGLIGIYCIIQEQYWLAAFFLILKSILDAADGELARIKESPSYTGRLRALHFSLRQLRWIILLKTRQGLIFQQLGV